jgi:signal transduction histidine kinase
VPIPSPPPIPSGRTLWLAPLLVFVLALLVTAALLVSVSRSITAKDRVAFDAEVTRTTDAVRERIDTTITLLHGTAGLFGASQEVLGDEFAAYVAQLRLRERYPGILGIGFSERFSAAELQRELAALRAKGQPDLRVWPVQPREEYHAVLFLEPLDARNRAAIGFDMYTDPTRRAAMSRARDDGVPAASGKVVLVQEIDERKQAGLLIYLPVYRTKVVPATVAERRSDLRGFVFAPLRVEDLLQGVRGGGPLQLEYEVYDGGDAQPAVLLRSTRAAGMPPPALTATRTLPVAGRPWLLRFNSSPGFESLSQRWLVPWLAATSVAASLLLAWITFVQARARRDAEAAAAQRRHNERALQESEQRSRERAERLQQLYGELREGERRKDEFLAVLAHELRNPLAPIRNSLEILRRTPDGPVAQRAREIAERQVRQMVRLIDDLLDVSRISRGKIVLQRERTALAGLVDIAVETSRPLIDSRGHRLIVGAVDPAIVLEIDPARVAQILTNLLNNAAHYTPPGGEIALTTTADAHEVRLSVRDNGIGIDPDKLHQVFELFRQVGSSAGGGLGIGLSLASRLAEMHGGWIEAHSEGLGRGAEFVVVLPRATAVPGGEHELPRPEGLTQDRP